MGSQRIQFLDATERKAEFKVEFEMGQPCFDAVMQSMLK